MLCRWTSSRRRVRRKSKWLDQTDLGAKTAVTQNKKTRAQDGDGLRKFLAEGKAPFGQYRHLSSSPRILFNYPDTFLKKNGLREFFAFFSHTHLP